MATTLLPPFPSPVLRQGLLTARQVECLVDWHAGARGDSDKTDDPHANAYYTGLADAYEAVLFMLFPTTDPERTQLDLTDLPDLAAGEVQS